MKFARFTWIYSIFITFFLSLGLHPMIAQNEGFTQTYRLDGKSSRFRNIDIFNKSLIVSGEIGTNSNGLAGIFIMQMDTFGEIERLKYYRDPLEEDDLLLDGLNSMHISSTGKIIISGVQLTSDDLYLLKLDIDLDTMLYKKYESDYRTMYVHDIVEKENYYYVIGRVQTQNYDLDILIQKIDSSGNSIWEKTYGIPTRNEVAWAAMNDGLGITIKITEEFNPTVEIKNDSRFWIRFMHIDTSGSILWNWEEEVTGDEGYGGTFVKFGSDYIYNTNFLGEEYSAGILQAAQLVRRDSAFNLVWRKVYGEPVSFSNYFGDMVMSRDSNLLLTGQILDDSGDFNWARVMKICPDGEIICETRDTGYVQASGESLNRMEGIIESPTGSIYAVGYTNRSLFLFDGLIIKISPDGCIDTLCTTTAIEDILRLQEQKIDTYPNPMQEELNIVMDESLPPNASISIYNTLGHLVFSEIMNGRKSTIAVADWPLGLYVVQAISNGKVVGSIKVIKNSK